MITISQRQRTEQTPPGASIATLCAGNFCLEANAMNIEQEIEGLKAREQERDRDLNKLEDRISEFEKTLPDPNVRLRKDENGIKKVIATKVQRQVRAALEDSIRHFFLYGSGRDNIDELVNNVFRAITKEE